MNIMKKSITVVGVILMSLVFSTGAFALGQVSESGQTTTQTKEFAKINELTLKGISDFTIVKSDSPMVSISGDKAFVEMIKMKEEGGYLYVESNVKYPVSLVVSTSSLKSLILSKASAGRIEGEFNMDSLSISLINKSSLTVKDALITNELTIYAGAQTTLNAEVYTKQLIVDSMGNSEIVLTGDAKQFDANFKQGSGVFKNLKVQYANITVAGGSSIAAVLPGNSITTVMASSDSAVSLEMNGILRANMSGDSTLEYAGNIEWVGKVVSDDAVVSSL